MRSIMAIGIWLRSTKVAGAGAAERRHAPAVDQHQGRSGTEAAQRDAGRAAAVARCRSRSKVPKLLAGSFCSTSVSETAPERAISSRVTA